MAERTLSFDIYQIDKFIEQNYCKEVTSPIFFNIDKNPTEDGLFSYEIFGYTDEERKNIYGYIDLGNKYIHPAVYKLFTMRMGVLKKVINNEAYAVVANRKIQIVPEDYPGADTGIDFFYNNYKDIDWITVAEEGELDSVDKKTRLLFLKMLKREDVFIDKWIVIPPHYRAESTTDKSLGDSINVLYKDLISRTRSSKTGLTSVLFGTASRMQVQKLLRQLYDTSMTPITGKTLDLETDTLMGNAKGALIKKNQIGKTIDYGSYTVITSPQISRVDKLSDYPIPFGYAMYPLRANMSSFKPFYLYEINTLMKNLTASIEQKLQVEIIDSPFFTPKKTEKTIDKFIKAETGIHDIIYFTVDIMSVPKSMLGDDVNIEDLENPVVHFEITEIYEGRNIKRPLTFLDVLYQATEYIVQDKHAYTTRHPVTNHQNIYPNKVKTSSTGRTRKVKIMDLLGHTGGAERFIEYPEYPYIKMPDVYPLEADLYYDMFSVTVVGNLVLKSLCGDYDGDMVIIRGVWTKEANAECAQLIRAKTNLFNAAGEISRALSKVEKEVLVTLYELTKDDE